MAFIYSMLKESVCNLLVLCPIMAKFQHHTKETILLQMLKTTLAAIVIQIYQLSSSFRETVCVLNTLSFVFGKNIANFSLKLLRLIYSVRDSLKGSYPLSEAGRNGIHSWLFCVICLLESSPSKIMEESLLLNIPHSNVCNDFNLVIVYNVKEFTCAAGWNI